MNGINSGRLVLLRHGESAFNKGGLFTGWSDCPLTPTGQRQAHEAGRALRDGGIAFDACFTSVLSRATETAGIVLDELGLSGLPVTGTWKLNERHYGILEGVSKTEAAARYGAAMVDAWRNAADATPPALPADDRRHPRFSALYDGIPEYKLPSTECLRDAFRRVTEFYEGEIRPLLDAGKSVLVVSHGNPVRALVAHIEGRPPDYVPMIAIENATPIIFAQGCWPTTNKLPARHSTEA